MIDSLFEEIYKSTHERFVESRKINSVEEFFEKDGIRYLAGLLNGKKNIPSYFLDEKGKEYLSTVINKVLSVLKDDQYFGSDQAIAFVVKVSKTPTDLEDLLRNHFDTVIEYGKCCNSEWFKKSDYVKKIMSATEYSGEDMHRLEKYLQEEHAKRSKSKNLKSNNTALYNTLYDDGEWKLFVPKNFEGDSELASHIEPFEYEGQTYNKTRWCTAAGKNYYDHYSYDNSCPLYIIQHWINGRYTDAWQVAFIYTENRKIGSHIEIMDKCDKRDWCFTRNCPNEICLRIVDKDNVSLLSIVNFNEDLINEETRGNIECQMNSQDDLDINYSYMSYMYDLQENLHLDVNVPVVVNSKGQLIDEIKKYNNPLVMFNLIIKDDFNIHDCYLQDCPKIKSITLPEGVTSIGYGAFSGCTNLENVNLPDSIIEIGDGAFSDCRNLENINIPKKLTKIASAQFYNCRSLKNVYIPDSIIEIGDEAFFDCRNLESINIPNNVNSINRNAFAFCPLTKLSASQEIMNRLKIGHVIIDENIGDLEFQNEMNIRSVEIKDGVTEIGDYAFAQSQIEYISFPNSIEHISENAFDNCYSIRKIDFSRSTKIPEGVFNKIDNFKHIDIPNNIKVIDEYAFSGCKHLESINIPNSVTSIGKGAFSWCRNLKNINIPSSITSIKDSTFTGCTSLENITIPNSVNSIGGSAFDGCTSLTSINIPNSVISIGSFAFNCCSGLTNINIPYGVSYISQHAFSVCKNLTSITIPDSVTSIDKMAFADCEKLENIAIPNGVNSIGENAFLLCLRLKNIAIPDSVKYIGRCAFLNTGITNIEIPSHVNLDDHAFDRNVRIIRRSHTSEDNFDSKLFEQIYRQCNQ